MTTLEQTWSRPRTFAGWLTDVSHRSIGLRYMVTGFVFLLLGGLAAVVMRLQLATPENELLGAERYDQVFTTHGVTMMFLFAVPIMEAFALYLVPLMIGTRELAFPRLNAFGYWLYLIGGSAIWISVFAGRAPDAGWFNYPPLSSARFSPGPNIDVYATAVPLVEIAAVIAAVELIVTILTHRAPGMSINRMPLFVWAVLVMAAMIVVAMPPLVLAGLLLALDRNLATSFFDSVGGGDPLLWQHLFWFFGHPEVYIMLLPGLGIVAMIISTFARRPTAGYTLVAAAFVLIGAISMGVWVHHMYATGSPAGGLALFSAATLSIVVPSGVQVFSALATLRHGRIELSVPLLFALGFIFVFVVGGLSGAQVASVPFDLQVHDTYFVVAHLHYVLLGGVVLPVLAGVYYWFPKLAGRLLDDRVGVASFVLIFIGINLTFFPMHLAGLAGMPRRVYTYPQGLGWDAYQLTATAGAVVLVVGMLTFAANVLVGLRSGRAAPPNPWGGATLEWLTDSPPRVHAFEATPVVRSPYPLWDEATTDSAEHVSADRRETLGTTPLDAVPEQRSVEPGPTVVPLVAAICVGVAFLGAIFDPLLVVVGLVLAALAFALWLLPAPEEWDMEFVRRGPDELPTSWVAASRGLRTPIQFGVLGLLASLLAFFGALISSYWYLAAKKVLWPFAGMDARPLALGIVATVPIVASAVPLVLSRRAVWAARPLQAAALLAGTAVLLLAGVVVLAVDQRALDYDWATNVTGSVDWALLGFWALAAVGAILYAAVAAVYAGRGFFNPERFDGVTSAVWYGTFVVALWLPIGFSVYLGQRIL